MWSAGRTAAATRKAALAILLALIGNNEDLTNLNARIYIENFYQLYPLLQSCLEDYDTSMRELAVSGLISLLNIIPHESLDAHATNMLYPAIIKRLDDSVDSIRLAACRAFTRFVQAAKPKDLAGNATDYCVEQLLIHLDDPSVIMQQRIYDTLSFVLDKFGGRSVAKIRSKLEEIKVSHRDPKLCTLLTKMSDGRCFQAAELSPGERGEQV